MFFGKVRTFARSLIGTDLSLVHYILALPDTGKGQVPEIAVDNMLKASTKDIHFLGGLQVRPQPEKEQSPSILSKLSNLSKLSMIRAYTRTFISRRKSIASSEVGGNFGITYPRAFPGIS